MSKERHSNIERIGLLELGLVIEKRFKWIFREQPLVDVGVDVIIEESNDGQPTGQFIAVQVKAGEEVLKESKNHYSYYFSNVHCNYWLNLSCPIILVFYNSKDEKLYWNKIDKTTIIKTKKHWKLEIKKDSILDINAKEYIEDILEIYSRNKNYGDVESDSFYDMLEASEYMNEAKDSIKTQIREVKSLSEKTKKIKDKIKDYVINRKHSDKSNAVQTQISRMAVSIEILKTRLSSEIDIFSQSFTKGVVEYNKLFLLNMSLKGKNMPDILNAESVLRAFPQAHEIAIKNMKEFKSVVDEVSEKYPKLKKAKRKLSYILECLIIEFEDAKDLSVRLIEKIDKAKESL